MGALSVANTFSAGTTIVASQMNTNFTDITTWAAGNPTLSADGNTTTIEGVLYVHEGIRVDSATPFVLEGATGNAHETSIAVINPTADNTITLPDATGTVALHGDGNASNVLSNSVFN